MNCLLDFPLEQVHHVEPDIHQLVGAHDGLCRVSPALSKRSSIGFRTTELGHIFTFLTNVENNLMIVFLLVSHFVMMRSTFIFCNIYKVNDSVFKGFPRGIEAVFRASIVVLVFCQNVHRETWNERTLQKKILFNETDYDC